MPVKPISEAKEPTVAATLRVPLYYRSDKTGGRLERYVFDREYVERLSRGESEVERHFTSYFGDLLSIKLRARLRSPQLAEDVRQDTLLRVLIRVRSKDGIKYPERFGAFVNSVCDNVILEKIREDTEFIQVPENAPERMDSAADPEAQMVTEERKALIRAGLAKLSKSDRRILQRVFLEEADKDALARELGFNRAYVRVLIHRALTRLRAALQKRNEGPPRTKATGA